MSLTAADNADLFTGGCEQLTIREDLQLRLHARRATRCAGVIALEISVARRDAQAIWCVAMNGELVRVLRTTSDAVAPDAAAIHRGHEGRQPRSQLKVVLVRAVREQQAVRRRAHKPCTAAQ